MNMYKFQHTFSEKRLCYLKRSTPDMLSKQIVEALQKTGPTTSEQLYKLIEKMKETADIQSAEVLHSVRNRLSTLQPDLLQIAWENLERLQEKSEEIVNLRRDVSVMLQQAGQEVSEGAGSIADTIQKSSLNPVNWKTQDVAAGAVVAVAVVGGFAVWNWLWKSGKKTAQKTSDTVKNTSSRLFRYGGFALLAGGAFAAGLFGWRALKRSFLAPLQDQIDKANALVQKGKEELDKAKDALSNAKSAVQEAEQRAVNGAQTAAQQMEMMKLRAQQELAESLVAAREVELAKREELVATMLQSQKESVQKESDNNEKQDTVANSENTGSSETTEELTSVGIEMLLAKSLLMMYPPDNSVEPDQVHDAIQLNRKTDIGDILQCYDETSETVTLTSAFIMPETDKKKRTAAAEYLVTMCAQHYDRVRSLYGHMSDEEFANTPLHDFVRLLTRGGSSAFAILDALKSAQGDPKKLMQAISTVDTAKILQETGDMDREIEGMIRNVSADLGLTQDQYENIHSKDVLLLLASHGGKTLNAFLAFVEQKGTAATPLEQIMAKQCEYILESTPRYLTPFFHKLSPFNDIPFTESNEENAKQVATIVGDRMPLRQVMQLHVYQRFIEDNNPAGLLLMQVEAAKYFRDKDESLWKQKSTQLGLRIGKVASGSTWDEWMREWETMDVAISDELWDKTRDIMWLLTKQGAVKLGELAKEGAEQVGGTYLGLLKEHPLEVGGVTAALSLFLKYRSDVRARPSKMLLNLNNMKGAVEGGKIKQFFTNVIPFHPHVRGSREAYTNAAKISDAVGDLMSSGNPAEVVDVGHKLQDAFTRCTTALDYHKAWERFRLEIIRQRGSLPVALRSKFNDTFTKLSRNTRTISQSPKQRYAAAVAARPLVNRFGIVNRLASGVRRVSTVATAPGRATMRHLSHSWQGASRLQRIGWIGTSVLGIAGTYAEHLEIKELEKQRDANYDAAWEYLADTIALIESETRPDGAKKYEKVERGVYRHTLTGVEFDVRARRRDVSEYVGQAGDILATAQARRRDALGAATAATILMGPKLAMGPAGGVVFVAEVAIRGGIAAWEQGKLRGFIADAPAWLLAAIGIDNATKSTDYDWLAKSSSWMVSDIWEGTEDKKEIRKKTLFTIFHGDLAQVAPTMLREILGSANPDILTDFYENDFETFVMPAFYAFLFRIAKSDSVAWSRVSEGRIQRDSLSNPLVDLTNIMFNQREANNRFIPPDVTFAEIRLAMREAAVLYTQHSREKRYMEFVDYMIEHTDEELPDEFVDFMSDAGQETALGVKLEDVDYDAYERRNKKTRSQMLLESLAVQISDAHGDTRVEKLLSSPNMYTVSADTADLDEDINLSAKGSMLAFTGSLQLSIQLQQSKGATLEEEISEKGKRWNDWSINQIKPPESVSTALDSLHYAAPFWLGDALAKDLGEQQLSPKPPSGLGAVSMEGIAYVLGTRDPKGISHESARQYATDAAVRLLTSEHNNHQPSFRRSTTFESRLYNNEEHIPVVLTSGVYTDGKTWELCRYLRYPHGIKNIQGVEASDIQAVMFEGAQLKSGNIIVMATYIVGDLENHNVNVIRQVAGKVYGTGSNGIRSEVPAFGQIQATAVADFLQEPGSQKQLEAAYNGILSQEIEQKEAEEQAITEGLKREEMLSKRKEHWLQVEAPLEFKDALEKVQHVSDRYVSIGRSAQFLLKDASSGNYVIYKPRMYSEHGSLSSAPKGKQKQEYGILFVQPSKRENNQTIRVFATADDALQYYVQGEASETALQGKYEFYSMDELDTFTLPLVLRPVTRSVHDIHRVIDLASQAVKNPRYIGRVRRYADELKQKLIPYYVQLKTDDKRTFFLQELGAQLRAHKNTVDPLSANKIGAWFTEHAHMFGVEKW